MDPSSVAQLIILIILLILSGIFSSAETALTTVGINKLRAELEDDNIKKRKKKKVERVLRLKEDSSKFLSAILIGNNLVNLSASALATIFVTKMFGDRFIGVATGILTILVLIFGEITPKNLATLYNLPLSLIYSGPVEFLMVIFTPVIFILNIISRGIFRLFGIDPDKNPDQMTEGELRAVVDASHEEGVIEQEEKKMITNVVDFGDAISKDIMVPRADMVCADINSSLEDILVMLKEETYSRIPVYEESKDHIVGILYMKDLMLFISKYGMNAKLDIRKLMRKPVFVYEYQRTAQIFADMKTSSVSMCIVLDEYGITAGVITMEDLIEEIVGDIRDEYDEEEEDLIREVSPGNFDVAGAVKLDDLNEATGLKLESENYDSIGGYIIELLDRLPNEGDEVSDGDIRFRVTKTEHNRVERVALFIPKKLYI